MSQFQHLFEPIQVGPMRVANRICETTNTINSSMVPGGIDDHFIAHHLAKAKGGAAWIGSETWLLNSPFPPETPDEIAEISRSTVCVIERDSRAPLTTVGV